MGQPAGPWKSAWDLRVGACQGLPAAHITPTDSPGYPAVEWGTHHMPYDKVIEELLARDRAGLTALALAIANTRYCI